MKAMIQVNVGTEWVDLMPFIGDRGDKALRDVMEKTKMRARMKREEPKKGGGGDVA